MPTHDAENLYLFEGWVEDIYHANFILTAKTVDEAYEAANRGMLSKLAEQILEYAEEEKVCVGCLMEDRSEFKVVLNIVEIRDVSDKNYAELIKIGQLMAKDFELRTTSHERN